MGVGGGSTAGAWVTYRRARACAWSTLRRIERVSNIPRNELFRAALAVILRARERLRDVDGGQAHLETILRHMGDLHELNWGLLGHDYDGYDGDGPNNEGVTRFRVSLEKKCMKKGYDIGQFQRSGEILLHFRIWPIWGYKANQSNIHKCKYTIKALIHQTRNE